MRKFGTKPGIGLLVGLLSVATFMAAPASAAHHHHHHHHHGGGGSGPVCGPGTVNIGGVCTPTGPSGPSGNSNVNITPNNVTMNLDGTFGSSVVVSGFPPFVPVITTNSPVCGNGVNIVVTGSGGATTDALGRYQWTLTASGPPGCVPGTYPLTFTETAVSPFQTFTGFITLHF